MAVPLVDCFVEALPDAERVRLRAQPAMVEALAEPLTAFVATARAAWPSATTTPEAFVAYLAQRWPQDAPDHVAVLRSMRGADLFLACGCAAADPDALDAFERRYASEIEAALRRLRLPPADVDEVQQLLRTTLFVSGSGRASKIAGYGGRGDLGSWLRVVVIRIGLRVLRRSKDEARAQVGEEAADAGPAGGDDPELAFLKRTYGAEFEAALAQAWVALPVRARLLLKQYFGYGLTVDELGAHHRVGRSTAARWVTAAREDLVARTRDALMERLGVGRPEVASILRLIDSQLVSKVAQLVRTAPPKK